MFQGEARFGRINEPKRCWAPPGVRPDSPYQVVRESTYVYAAVSPHDGTLDTLILPETNTTAMTIFVEEVARRHPDEFYTYGFGFSRLAHRQTSASCRTICSSFSYHRTAHNSIQQNTFGMKYAKNGSSTKLSMISMLLKTYSSTLYDHLKTIIAASVTSRGSIGLLIST